MIIVIVYVIVRVKIYYVVCLLNRGCLLWISVSMFLYKKEVLLNYKEEKEIIMKRVVKYSFFKNRGFVYL